MRWATIAGMALVLSAVPAATTAQEAPASPLLGYQATAMGTAVTAFPRLPALLPVEAPLEATLSLATVTLSSGGQGFGRASTFFPGTLAANLRPLIETGAGTRLPIPDYPIVVEAREFEEAKRSEVPGVTMHVDVDPARAVAVADLGGLSVPAVVGVHAARTESRTVLASSTITATSTTTLSGIDIAGVVTIGSLVSTASVTSDGTTATCRGGVAIEDVAVAGTPATLDDDGLHVAGDAVAPGLGLGPLVSDLLRSSGIQVRVLGGDDACTGSPLGSRTTAGLLVNIPTPAIGPISPGGLQAVLGSTSATAGGSTLPPDGGGTPVDLPPTFGEVVTRLPGPFAGGGTLPPSRPPSAAETVTDLTTTAAYAFDGVPLSLLGGLALLAVAAAARVRRYLDHIIGLAGP